MRAFGFIVAIDSFLVRKGMVSLLGRIPYVRTIREFSDANSFQQYVKRQGLDFLVITESLFELSAPLFDSRPDLLEKTILLKNGPDGKTEIHNSINLSDGKEQIEAKIRKLTELHAHSIPGAYVDDLSQREKTIVRQVSLGLTNKQIAETLFLSTHTVITHRKNISSKLGIKSVSGLTVYAIVNNIITIEELSSEPS